MEGLQLMEQRTRKQMTMHMVLGPSDDIDRLYVSRKEGGKGLVNIKDSVDELMQLHKKEKRRTVYIDQRTEK